MSVFQFLKFARVTVPAAMAGAENVQGIVAEGHAELGSEPRYILQWPSADKLGDAGLFTMIVGEVGQEVLIKAQPPAMILATEAQSIAKNAHENGRRLERDMIAHERDMRVIARLQAKRKTRRKAGARKRSR
jgi:hypothetical protein